MYKRIHIPITDIYQRDAQNDRFKLNSYLFFGNMNAMIIY